MTRTAAIEVEPASWSTETGQPRLFSGHESFVCRHGWLVKLYHAIEDNPKLFAEDDKAILALGLGRNMVKSIRFWGQAFGLTASRGGETINTDFAHRLINAKSGIDPFLEDIGTLWRLHWQISTHGGLGAWCLVLQDTPDARITRDRLIGLTQELAAAVKGPISQTTAAVHVDIFLRTYDWSRGDALSGSEEGAGSPFQDLKLIETSQGNGGVVASINRGPKPDLRISDFAFALRDYWAGTARGSDQLSLRSLQLGKRGPASAFRLDEGSLFILLEELTENSSMEIQSDGAGGKALVSRNGRHLDELEVLAWQAN